jgi:hypothetical protein
MPEKMKASGAPPAAKDGGKAGEGAEPTVLKLGERVHFRCGGDDEEHVVEGEGTLVGVGPDGWTVQDDEGVVHTLRKGHCTLTPVEGEGEDEDDGEDGEKPAPKAAPKPAAKPAPKAGAGDKGVAKAADLPPLLLFDGFAKSDYERRDPRSGKMVHVHDSRVRHEREHDDQARPDPAKAAARRQAVARDEAIRGSSEKQLFKLACDSPYATVRGVARLELERRAAASGMSLESYFKQEGLDLKAYHAAATKPAAAAPAAATKPAAAKPAGKAPASGGGEDEHSPYTVVWHTSMAGGLVSKDRNYSIHQDTHGHGVVLRTPNGDKTFSTTEQAKAFAQRLERAREKVDSRLHFQPVAKSDAPCGSEPGGSAAAAAGVMDVGGMPLLVFGVVASAAAAPPAPAPGAGAADQGSPPPAAEPAPRREPEPAEAGPPRDERLGYFARAFAALRTLGRKG